MGYAFISYSHKDKEYVDRLQAALEEEGFEVWVDERINYGEEWTRVVQQHVDGCDAFIAVISKNAEESDWVQSELARAKRKKKPIFPLLLEGEPWLTFEAINYEDISGGILPPRKFYDRLAEKTTRQKKKPATVNTPTLEEAKDYFRLGLRLASQNRFDDAIQAYKQAILRNPDHVYAYCNLGVLLKEQGRVQDAEKAFRQAIRIDPDDAASYFYLGVLLSERKQTSVGTEGEKSRADSASRSNLTGSQEISEDEESCRRAVKANSMDAAAWNRLGVVMEKRGRNEEAEEAYKWAVMVGKKGIAADCNLGWLLYGQKKYSEAEQVFSKAVEKEPANPEAHFGLGELFRDMKRSEEAIKAYQKVFELDPEHATACYNLGILLESKKKQK
jgi:tetratricopeptide (TPR) repeat protein